MVTATLQSPQRDQNPSEPGDLRDLLAASSQCEVRRLEVSADGGVVTLTGRVSSFYFKQLAQESLKRALAGRTLCNRVEVAAG